MLITNNSISNVVRVPFDETNSKIINTYKQYPSGTGSTNLIYAVANIPNSRGILNITLQLYTWDAPTVKINLQDITEQEKAPNDWGNAEKYSSTWDSMLSQNEITYIEGLPLYMKVAIVSLSSSKDLYIMVQDDYKSGQYAVFGSAFIDFDDYESTSVKVRDLLEASNSLTIDGQLKIENSTISNINKGVTEHTIIFNNFSRKFLEQWTNKEEGQRTDKTGVRDYWTYDTANSKLTAKIKAAITRAKIYTYKESRVQGTSTVIAGPQYSNQRLSSSYGNTEFYASFITTLDENGLVKEHIVDEDYDGWDDWNDSTIQYEYKYIEQMTIKLGVYGDVYLMTGLEKKLFSVDSSFVLTDTKNKSWTVKRDKNTITFIPFEKDIACTYTPTFHSYVKIEKIDDHIVFSNPIVLTTERTRQPKYDCLLINNNELCFSKANTLYNQDVYVITYFKNPED